MVKVGGLNVETQLVSGDVGLSKNEALDRLFDMMYR